MDTLQFKEKRAIFGPQNRELGPYFCGKLMLTY